MTLSEVALKVARPESLWGDLTRRFPSTSIFIWCNRENDVVEVAVRNPEDYPLVVKEIRACSIADVIEEIADDQRLYLNVSACHCMKQNTIVRHIGELDILNIFPNILCILNNCHKLFHQSIAFVF